MIDEIYDRNYQAGRADLHAGIDRAVHRIGRALAISAQALHRVQWSAPWTKDARDVGHA